MIDFHTHQPSADPNGEPFFTAAEYVQFMDELGVSLSAMFTFDGLRRPSPVFNDSLARYVAGRPERLIAFATLDPWARDAVDELDRCVETLGMRGIKLHPWLQGFSPHQGFMDDICEAAARHQVPIVFHDGTPPYSAPLQIALLAKRHPRTSFVLGHGGLHDMWREAIEATNTSSNLYLCMCSSPFYSMQQTIKRCDIDRLLFGTDGGISTGSHQHYTELRVRQLEHLDLTDEQKRAIFQVNPSRLLRLGGTDDI